MNLYYDEMVTPVGTLFLASTGEKIIRIEYGTREQFENNRMKWLKNYFGDVTFIHDSTPFPLLKEQLEEYFQNNRNLFSFDFELYGTDFQKKVWQALYDFISFGDSKTYKDIAEIIGNPKAVRAVGGAVNKNPLSVVIPCHRVVGTNGKLIGYNGGLDKKEFLLNHESIKL